MIDEVARNSGEDLIDRLRSYEAASNRFDIDSCVAMFTEDGAIDDHGMRVCGRAALRDAHEFDRAVNAHVAFDEVVVTGNVADCRFIYTKELDRLLGTGGFHQRARFTFRDGLFEEFAVVGADEEEIERHRRLKAPFLAWAKRHHPEAHARLRSFDAAGGTALRWLGDAWNAAGRPIEPT